MKFLSTIARSVIASLLGVYGIACAQQPLGKDCEGPVRFWTSCVGTTKVSNGVYSGFFQDGKFHGRGRLETLDKRIFSGEWSSGNFSGVGIVENRMSLQCTSQLDKTRCRGVLRRWTGQFRSWKFIRGTLEVLSYDDKNPESGVLIESKEGVWDGFFDLKEGVKTEPEILIQAREAAGVKHSAEKNSALHSTVERLPPSNDSAKENRLTESNEVKDTIGIRLKQLKELHQQGLISTEQLNEQVNKLLNR